MSKTDMARPILHRQRESSEAHLAVVFTALAVARFIQIKTGLSLKKIITTISSLWEFVGEIDGHELVFPPDIQPAAADLTSYRGKLRAAPGN